ncbi:MAG: hypothetical protein AUK55_08310 [Syntrophobacteraceae bacterium CG2_30_61_12]|nr:MAG: hypothetical protein AUK55_08310 [Syntrophobacteraceae bacterium CG2_30_61_12]
MQWDGIIEMQKEQLGLMAEQGMVQLRATPNPHSLLLPAVIPPHFAIAIASAIGIGIGIGIAIGIPFPHAGNRKKPMAWSGRAFLM